MSFQHAKDPTPRKLRFITNQGAPLPKRRRVNAACFTCRRRKIACSGEHPVCNTCQQGQLQCAGYARAGDKDGRKARTSPEQHRQEPLSDQSRANSHQDYLSHVMEAGNASINIKAGTSSSVPTESSSTLLPGTRNRMPYFRWLGPTAIMPGFKQMVVKVNQHRPGTANSANECVKPSPKGRDSNRGVQRGSTTFAITDVEVRKPLTLPFYDTSSTPPSELITHLCETFFVHLGCNFPFLQKERFLKDLEAKQVDAILVDTVCAMAARFSSHDLLVEQADENGKSVPSEYGQAFAHRARVALIETYPVPSVAAVQAALLLAYIEFGESRDSGLWMYLGISIRMAQDLGLQKLEGLRLEGRQGPTPKMVKNNQGDRPRNPPKRSTSSISEIEDEQELRAVERERIDTFWAVFFLDKVVSSGTGRRSTLRDNDIELSFPPLENPECEDEWPSPFPALIRIVHLYGRVADLLNSIKEPSDIGSGTGKRLASMEARVTDFFQSLSPRLHFEAMNFHHYVKAGAGTSFVLLHFWFHTLIILLHQPTLLKTFEGKMPQLFPNSQQLSMSSAKTIADILSYSQLIDAKACLGNPFTTQPIYIAACAFLRETAERSANSAGHSHTGSREESRAGTPSKQGTNRSRTQSPIIPTPKSSADAVLTKSNRDEIPGKSRVKHTLLVKRATQDYQLCHQALQSIETYWAGTKYILTVLDQKVKGVGDPLLYTVEEGERSLEQPVPLPMFTSPGWRRKLVWTPSLPGGFDVPRVPVAINDTTFRADQDLSEAIGWSVTGNLNSTNTNLSKHYPTRPPQDNQRSMLARGQSQLVTPQQQQLQQHGVTGSPSSRHGLTFSGGSLPPPLLANQQLYQSAYFSPPRLGDPSQAGTNYCFSSAGAPVPADSYPNLAQSSPTLPIPPSFNFNPAYDTLQNTGVVNNLATAASTMQLGDITIESQDVDMSMLGPDMLSWLTPPPPDDLMGLFEAIADVGDLGAGNPRRPSSAERPHYGDVDTIS